MGHSQGNLMAISRVTPLRDRPLDKEFLYVAGVVALGIFALGMVWPAPTVRRAFGNTNLDSMLSNEAPEVERYFRLRSS